MFENRNIQKNRIVGIISIISSVFSNIIINFVKGGNSISMWDQYGACMGYPIWATPHRAHMGPIYFTLCVTNLLPMPHK